MTEKQNLYNKDMEKQFHDYEECMICKENVPDNKIKEYRVYK